MINQDILNKISFMLSNSLDGFGDLVHEFEVFNCETILENEKAVYSDINSSTNKTNEIALDKYNYDVSVDYKTISNEDFKVLENKDNLLIYLFKHKSYIYFVNISKGSGENFYYTGALEANSYESIQQCLPIINKYTGDINEKQFDFLDILVEKEKLDKKIYSFRQKPTDINKLKI